MSALRATSPLPPPATPQPNRLTLGGLALGGDLQAVLWLAALPMLAASVLPWVMLRPNRLAPGHYLHLPAPTVMLGLLLALALPLAGRFWPRAVAVIAALALALGTVWLGQATTSAVADSGAVARASASSGWWLWLLGSGVALYGAGLIAGQLRQAQWLRWLWLALLLLVLAGGELGYWPGLRHWSVVQEFSVHQGRVAQELGQHIRLVLSGLGLAVLISAPLAVWASRSNQVSSVVMSVAGGIQTIPSLALLGLLIAPLAALSSHFPALREAGISGIGTAPALCAMTLYALLPIVRNGLVALRGVPSGVMDAARGMGMTDNQRFWRVQLPLALPVWLSGVRQAAVMLVGVASVAQLIGAGGLGYFIFSGMQSGAADLILLGVIPAAALAIVLDMLLRALETLTGRPLGLLGRGR